MRTKQGCSLRSVLFNPDINETIKRIAAYNAGIEIDELFIDVLA